MPSSLATMTPNKMAFAFLALLFVPTTSLAPFMRVPVARTHRPARVSRLVALEPHLDSSAAFACIFSLSPVVLAYHWGTEFNEVRGRLTRAKEELQIQKLRLMCGEDCLVDYQEAEAEVVGAHQAVHEFSNFRVAGATQELLTQMGFGARRATANRRAPQAVMKETAEHEDD